MSEARVAEGSAVVLVDDRLGEVVPAAAVPLLRGAAVFAEPGLAPAAREALGAPEPPADLLARAAGEPVVLFVGDLGCADA
ncbi:nucleoside triphosphate pyrophosphohydrolase, partial [Saccharopolyspora kobensis]